MPRGVPKAGFRMTKKRKASMKKSKSVFTSPKAAKPVNMAPVNKPKKVAAVEAPKTMDVPSFLAKLKEATEALRACSGMTTHEKEAELLMNFAICLERQVERKYLVATRYGE